MQDISTNTHTVIKDSRGRPALIVADTLSGVAIGETIPEGTLGYDKNSGSLSRFVSGSWVTTLVQSGITGNVTGDVTGNTTGLHTGNIAQQASHYFNRLLDVYGSQLQTGVISEETTLSTVALATNGATQIPAKSRVLAVFALVTEVIDTATAIEIGITAVDTDGYATTMGVAANTASIAQGALVGLANPRASATTYTILANGQPSATGKVHVSILYETFTAPDLG